MDFSFRLLTKFMRVKFRLRNFNEISPKPVNILIFVFIMEFLINN